MPIDIVIQNLIADASDPTNFAHRQDEASHVLPTRCSGTVWPHNGCAIMQSVLLRHAGLTDLPYTCMALDLVNALKNRGWNRIEVGDQQPGDIGTTCGDVYHEGVDHVYLMLDCDENGMMTVADNQAPTPHSRPVAGNGTNFSPTTYFLRA